MRGTATYISNGSYPAEVDCMLELDHILQQQKMGSLETVWKFQTYTDRRKFITRALNIHFENFLKFEELQSKNLAPDLQAEIREKSMKIYQEIGIFDMWKNGFFGSAYSDLGIFPPLRSSLYMLSTEQGDDIGVRRHLGAMIQKLDAAINKFSNKQK